MGVEMSIWQITPSGLDSLLKSEDAVTDFMDSRLPEYTEDEGVPGHETEESDREDEGLWLGKTWHLLHFLITGDPESKRYPLAYAVMAGHSLHESWPELTYVAQEEVRDIADALVGLSEEDLRSNAVSERILTAEIYRHSGRVDEDDFEYTLDLFCRLRAYYQDASRNGNSMLRYFH